MQFFNLVPFDFIVFVKKNIDDTVLQCKRFRVMGTEEDFESDGFDQLLKVAMENKGLVLFTSIVKTKMNEAIFANFYKDFTTIGGGQNLI